MRLVFKILKICLLTVISLTILLFIASFVFQDKVAGLLLSTINKDLTTKIEIGSARLSFLREFPNASLHLKDIVVFSSQGFDKTVFNSKSTDTLMSAEKLSVEFSITDIIKQNYNISTINISDGRLNIFTDKQGMINYDIDFGGEDTGEDDIINLDRINVENVYATYDNLAIDMQINLKIIGGKFKSRISGNAIELKAQSELFADTFRLGEFSIPTSFFSEIDIDLITTDSITEIKKGSFGFGNQSFVISGFSRYSDNYDFRLISERVDIVNIKKFLPVRYIDYLNAYSIAGILNIEAGIRGISSRTSIPEFNIDFSLSNGRVSLPDSPLSLNELSLEGIFTNTPGPEPDSSLLVLKNIKGDFQNENFSASCRLTDFEPISGSLDFDGNIILSDVVTFFRIPHIKSATGTVSVNLMVSGSLPGKEKPEMGDFLRLNSDIELLFNSFGIRLDNGISISKVNGGLNVSDRTIARNLAFTYQDQTFRINGWFEKLPEWLAGENVQLRSSATVEVDKLFPETFLKESVSSDTINPSTAIKLPSDLYLDLNLIINQFKYKTYSADKISAILSYKPKLLSVSSLTLNSLDGFISGNGLLVQNRDKSLIGKGTFEVKDIDINNTFKTFRNFGQDFIVADNLSGRVSGKISILIPSDSLLNPNIKSITAEGHYIVSDGTLRNFEPVKALSGFIEVSELENISFEKLENDFFIRNNFLYIPQMDVKSSAADLTVNGKHSFDNDYEYHVSVVLSELLSKKIRKPKPNTTEFGAIRDDGLGRTSLLLKIEDKGDDVKVSYDVKAAGAQIKNSIKSERQTMKTILNQEYGWFKGDSAFKQTPAVNSAPRFRISWDEADTIKSTTEKSEPRKENPIKSIFKKK